ncbi:hypothetical protein SAMN04488063_3642 [Halopelagius inordinatus]|uniref:DUF7344 domain-containing protein n=1 Tax=Halopelagius inordinatus TaxID=553467 RepID=A0A1I2WQB1_9EURY|nr:hypothetical protein [Halopelagius inordinatus]SFH03372.1 hypothetical protein SAMN04488063_3642 [Halopelagius inordinatus]
MGTTVRNGESAAETAFRVIADELSRYTIVRLSATPDGVASRRELADYVGTRSTAVETRKRVTARLHHVVLPRLEAAGLIEYDPRSATVRYYPEPVVESLLDHVEVESKESE